VIVTVIAHSTSGPDMRRFQGQTHRTKMYIVARQDVSRSSRLGTKFGSVLSLHRTLGWSCGTIDIETRQSLEPIPSGKTKIVVYIQALTSSGRRVTLRLPKKRILGL
jgi:hypothetical protein